MADPLQSIWSLTPSKTSPSPSIWSDVSTPASSVADSCKKPSLSANAATSIHGSQSNVGVRQEAIGSAMRKPNELNPDSQVFHPFGSPVRTVPDISTLSIIGSDRSSSPTRSSAVSFRTPSLSPHKTAGNILQSSALSSSTALNTPGSVYDWSPLTDKHAQRVLPGHSPRTPPGALLFPEGGEAYNAQTTTQSTTDSSRRVWEAPVSEVQGGRYLAINGIPPDVSAEEIRNALNSLAEFKSIVIRHYKLSGVIFVAFYDPREALKVFSTLRDKSVAFRPGGKIIRLTCTDVTRDIVEQTVVAEANASILRQDSEPCIEVEVCGPQGIAKAGMKPVQECLEKLGEVRWVQSIGQDGRRFNAEFWDTRDAALAVHQLNRLREDPEAGQLWIRAFIKPSTTPGVALDSTPAYTLGSAAWSNFPRRFAKSVSAPLANSSGFTTTRDSAPLHMPYQVKSYVPPTTAPRWTSAYDRRAPAPMVRVFSRSSSESHTASNWRSGTAVGASAHDSYSNHVGGREVPSANIVWPERIMSGLDSRTTVMVKDVPNKLTRDGLVEVLNSVVPRQFDFVYLRFDFRNQCNVGYAFVNFTSVRALYELYEAKVGRKWNMFSSDKILQVCYANIQGKQALINKFRNSAVMEVMESWRPQIFYSSGALQGKPEPFPSSDNIAQKSRSNALRLSSLDNTRDLYEVPAAAYDYDRASASYVT